MTAVRASASCLAFRFLRFRFSCAGFGRQAPTHPPGLVRGGHRPKPTSDSDCKEDRRRQLGDAAIRTHQITGQKLSV
jgi:hypothetical protein